MLLRSPRVWLYAAGGWLIVAGLAHGSHHVWTYALENGMIGLREFAMNAMKQADSFDPLRPSLWRQFRMFSASFSLLLILAGAVDVLLAALPAQASVLRAFALLGTIFWTVAFVPFAFPEPVLHGVAIAAVAVPLHAIAYVTASVEAHSDH